MASPSIFKSGRTTNSRLDVFCEKGVLKIFAQFIEKHHPWHPFLSEKMTDHWCFLWNFENGFKTVILEYI